MIVGGIHQPFTIGMQREGATGAQFVDVFLKEHNLRAALRSVRFVGSVQVAH